MKPFVLIEDIRKFQDARGFFYESYKEDLLLEKYGLKNTFVQDNHSISKKNVIRGLHYQWDQPMNKLVRVSNGSIIDIIVDIRKKSPDFGKVYKFSLSAQNINQLWVPAGYAHGFISLEDNTHVQYKCTEVYSSNGEGGINPFDSTLNIDWGIPREDAICSLRDKTSQDFSEYMLNPKF